MLPFYVGQALATTPNIERHKSVATFLLNMIRIVYQYHTLYIVVVVLLDVVCDVFRFQYVVTVVVTTTSTTTRLHLLQRPVLS